MTEPLATGELLSVDPQELVVEANVRTEASLTKQFIASIRENGVLVPIVAVRGEDGALLVRMGQRRTLAAREAGLKAVPVYVTDADADTATRLVQQITENDQRLALGDADRVKGIQTLLDTGLSVTKVAKKLAVSPERVKQSKAVANSQAAMEALHDRELTLAEAAAIAEFEDEPDVVDKLLQAAGRAWFDAEVERFRRMRAERAERQKAAKAYTEQGFTVLEEYPGYGDGWIPLHHLRTADGSEPDESVVTDPSLWAVMLEENPVFYDADGNKVDETLIDWGVEGQPDEEPEEGKLHPDVLTEVSEFTPEFYFCRDPQAVGLSVDDRYAKLAKVAASLPEGAPEPQTPADLERKEAEKAERRRVLTLNKAGAAAETVRRKFLTDLLKRKTAPDGAMVFLARLLSDDPSLLGGYRGMEVASELLGADVRTGELLDHASEGRAQVILLGMALGALESMTPKSAWRDRAQFKETVAYLRFLESLGYGLSPVEQVVVGDMTVDKALEELA